MELNRKKSRTDTVDEKMNEGLLTRDNSTMEILNNDCLLQIFEYLPIGDRIRLGRVNKRWRSISLTSWRSLKKLNFTRDTWGFFDQMQVSRNVLGMSDSDIFVGKIYIRYTLERCHNLTSLNFNSFKLNSKLLGVLVMNCQDIEESSIGQSYTSVSDYLIERTILLIYENLKFLNFKDNEMTGWCLKVVNNTIEELHLEFCNKLDFSCIQNLLLVAGIVTLQKLQTLSLRGSLNYCFDNSYLSFLDLTNIKVLDISNSSKYINDKCLIRITDSCRNLLSLDFSHNYKVTDKGLAAMTTFNLKHLRINSLWRVSGTSLTDLPSLKSELSGLLQVT